LERALDRLEAGDVLVVTKLDRLARSTHSGSST
jgi:DNA invertase Pin-like site-specific DNA recombinase